MSDDFDITLECKLESKAEQRDGSATDVRRIELITGAGRRRRWSSEDKGAARQSRWESRDNQDENAPLPG